MFEELLDAKYLFQTNVKENTFVWRLLSLKEFNRFRAMRHTLHQFVFFNAIFERCLIGNPASLNSNLPAGIPISIGELIYWHSGECEHTTLVNDLDVLRSNFNALSVHQYMRSVIFTAWNNYTPEDLDKFSYAELLNKFTEAEAILNFRLPDYKPLDLRKIGNKNDKKPGAARDFEKENRELAATGATKVHPLDMNMDEFSQVSKRDIARKLDQKNRRR